MSLFKLGNKSATEIFQEKFDMARNEETNKVEMTFNTHKGQKGFGSQVWAIDDMDEITDVLQDLVDNGLEQNTIKTTAESIRSSITLNEEDDTVRFKSDPSKGKRPTLFKDVADFNEFCLFIIENKDKMVAYAHSEFPELEEEEEEEEEDNSEE